MIINRMVLKNSITNRQNVPIRSEIKDQSQAAITIEQFLKNLKNSFCKDRQFPLSSPLSTLLTMFFIWLYTLACTIPPLFNWGQVRPGLKNLTLEHNVFLKVPKREIFDRSDFTNFYTIKSSWVGELLVKILTYYFNF
jgi:hypothetical protein